jgi:hypothetical protein
VVTINGHSNKLRIWEKGAGLRGPWEHQKKRWEEDRRSPRFGLYSSRPSAYDKGATGELNASILGYSSRQDSWGDRKRWRLEDRLPQLLREPEVQAVEAEERQLAREREEADASADGKSRWSRPSSVFSRPIGAKCSASVCARDRRPTGSASTATRSRTRTASAVAADPAASASLAYARGHADRLQTLPDMPPDPEITPEALKRCSGGMSPCRPRGW